jgi:hypothetical protein
VSGVSGGCEGKSSGAPALGLPPQNFAPTQHTWLPALLPSAQHAAMWDAVYAHVDKAAHMRAMFELTTRMNSLARIVVGPANISATTALQVSGCVWRGGVAGCCACTQQPSDITPKPQMSRHTVTPPSPHTPPHTHIHGIHRRLSPMVVRLLCGAAATCSCPS